MAKATRTLVERTVTDEVFTLELDSAERAALVSLLGEWGGSDLNAVCDALLEPEDAPVQPVQPTFRPIRVGDRVRVTADEDTDLTGEVGTLDRIDEYDSHLPYRVRWDDEDCSWVHRVEHA